ncbi:MAG TPA: GPP34 family phosphoprotein [Nocardioidaceae bacterium]|nr:GPP34 family phosphoprotein [Nocardioidaceae bacterium]
MLIAEDLLLLLTDDAAGKLAVSGVEADIALGGANLVELALLERVDVTGEADGGRTGRLVVRDPSPTGDPLLDSALMIIGQRQGKKPAAAISPLSKDLRDTLFGRLVDRGILRAERGKILGIFPTRSWPAQDASHEAEVRRLVTQSLVHGITPDPRTAALVSLLHALKAVPKVVDPREHGVAKRDLQAHAKQIAEGDWASKAVRQAIDEMMAAVMAATTVATTAAATS